MSEKVWQKISYLMGLLPLGALFGIVAYVGNIEVKDLDLWLHIAMGRFITEHHYVPNVDILSFVIAGKPWINHEWLFQVIVYNIFNNFGPDGLLKMQVVVVVLTMMILLLLGYNKDNQLIVNIFLIMVFMVYQQRFTIRPDIFSLLFFALYIFILALHIDKKWAAWALFFIQILWSNMHGFFFFGPLFILIGIVSESIKRHVKLPYEWNESGRLTDQEFSRLRKAFIFVILACLINPYFLKGAWYPIGVFFSLSGENNIFFEYIQELQKPIAWSTLFDPGPFVYYKLLILISIVSFVFNRRRIDISALFFWVVFLLFSLIAVRNTPFFAFAAYLVIITNMLTVSFKDIVPLRFTAKKFQYLTSTIAKFLLLLWLLDYSHVFPEQRYYDFDKYDYKSEFGGISLRTYPNKAADFLVKNKIQGNFFNDFNSGAYLLGRCSPNIKVFIDGRTEVYGGSFFKLYRSIWEEGDTQAFEKVVQQYHITGAFLNSSRQHIPKQIFKYLYQHKDWKVIYFDYDAVIMLKDIPQNKKIIDQFAIDLTKWQTKKHDHLKLGPTRVTPYQNYYRSYSFESLDLDDLALKEAQEAIKVTPAYREPYEIIGKIYGKRKDYKNAFKNFRLAAMIDPGNKDTRYNLALSYFDMGEYEMALKQYNEIRAAWPKEPKAAFFVAKVYAKSKKYDEALKTLREAHVLDPNDAMDIVQIGDVIYEQNEYLKAKEAYTLALSTKKEMSLIHKKLGLVYEALKDIPNAKKEFEKALSIYPENQEIKNKLKALEQIQNKVENKIK